MTSSVPCLSEEDLVSSLRGLDLVCPACKSSLQLSPKSYECSSCRRTYPIVSGIPDFRILGDRYLSEDEDRRRVDIILDVFEKKSFRQVLDHYWSFSDITPDHLRPRYVAAAYAAKDKSKPLLEALGQTRLNSLAGKTILDVGCGTGGALLAASECGAKPIAVDIGMRWLQITRKRFAEAGRQCPPLICGSGEHLPFPHNSVDSIICADTIEFAHDQRLILSEMSRVLKPTGAALLRAANRFTITRDPFVHLYGIGWLPRNVQSIYAKMAANAHFSNVQMLSRRELRALLDRHFEQIDFLLPEIKLTDSTDSSLKFQASVYDRLRQNPLFKPFLMEFGPAWNIILQEPRRCSQH